MQFTPVLMITALMIVIDAANIPRVRIPIQDLVNDTTTSKMPTERHRDLIFPRNVIKFVVTPTPRQHVTDKTTRKPLMKKLIFQNDNNVIVKHTTPKLALKNSKRLNVAEYNNIATGKLVNSSDVKKDFQESKDTSLDIPDEEIQNPKSAVYPTNVKENKNVVNKRILRPKRLLPLDNHSDEYLDWQEFIFLSPSKQTEKKQTSVEESDEEYITTEKTLKPGFGRMKRSNNIIEEENLGTTVAGYKFTWHDTRLTHNLVFKNIHS